MNQFSTVTISKRVFNHQWMKQKRIKKGLTQRALAKKVGVSAPFISDVEAGKRSVSEQTATKIIKVLK